MLMIKLLELSRWGALYRLESGPALEKITGLQAVEFSHPIEGLGEIKLQVTGQLMGELGLQIHQLPAMLDPQGELAAQRIVWHPGLKLLSVFDQQVQQQGGIVGIIFGPTGKKGLSVAGQRLGIDGVEPEKVIVHQGGHHGSPALLEGQGYPALRKPL